MLLEIILICLTSLEFMRLLVDCVRFHLDYYTGDEEMTPETKRMYS
jgi:hypothetical protein